MQKNVWDKKRIVETITEDLSAENAVVFAKNDSDNYVSDKASLRNFFL